MSVMTMSIASLLGQRLGIKNQLLVHWYMNQKDLRDVYIYILVHQYMNQKDLRDIYIYILVHRYMNQKDLRDIYIIRFKTTITDFVNVSYET